MALIICYNVLFSLIGYLWSSFISYNNNLISRLGYAFFLGQTYFVITSYFGFVSKSYFNIINVSVLVLLLILYFIYNRNKKLNLNLKLSKKESLAIVFVTGLYSIYYFNKSTLDTINHFFMASQIKLGKIPPTTYAFPNISIKYHYGWDLLLGNYSRLTGLKFDSISSLLTVLFLVSSLFVLLGFLRKQLYRDNTKLVAIILFYVGGGIIVIVSNLYGNRIVSGGLSVSSQIGQSSWTFGIFIFLMLLDLLKSFKYNVKYLLNFLLLSPILITIGLTTASGYVLILMTFIIILVNFIANKKPLKLNSKPLLLIVLCFLFFFILSGLVGGIMINGNYYDNPKFIFAPLDIPFDIYFERIIAYLFFFSPIATFICVHSIFIVLKNIKNIFKLSLIYQFLYANAIGLYLFPVFIWVENAAYWDNFCKFNYYGILASWILLFKYINPIAKKLKLSSSKFILVYIFFVLFLGNEFFYRVYKSINFDSKNNSINLGENQNYLLLKSIENNISLNNNIYLLNKNLKGMYVVDTLTNKSKVNLYNYINVNFGKFKDVSMLKGRSIANFYDFNFLISRDLEAKLWQTLDGLYKGNSKILENIRGEFILSSITELPTFAVEWEIQNKITVIEKSIQEDWIIFKVK